MLRDMLSDMLIAMVIAMLSNIAMAIRIARIVVGALPAVPSYA